MTVCEMSDVRALLKTFCEVEACGSRVTCFPPPKNTDADYLVFVSSGREDDVSKVVNLLSGNGFTWEGASEHYQVVAGYNFMSWRKDDINFIVSASYDFVKRHRAATAICKRLNLLDKTDRIAVFKAVLYGEVAA